MVEHVGDHYDRAEAVTPRWWRGKPAFMALVKVLQLGVQELEDSKYDNWVSRRLDLAQGSALDWWGWFSGAGPRGGLEAQWYRKLIRLALAVRSSTGDVDSCIRRWQLATAPSQVEFYRYPKNAVALVAFRDEWMPEAYAVRAAEILRKGGPFGTIMLFEALTTYLGSDERTATPVPATPTTSAPGAKDW